ncbi:sensor histidine kinase [Naumannella cuiyingiana]|uniref:histidine kinase n=1 Tax=Naumannella cuiyingiana TaxID=1347891 RepID=A0A7Z0D908_9ACTN|nr:sensor histidine kinase [Naumannella cuiyingiana]NYI71040.1 signal transduction histidine kinase [Naumannella cuiyingiana]
MKNPVRWIVEPGYRSEQAAWWPSLVLSGMAVLVTAVPWALLAIDQPRSPDSLRYAALFLASLLVTGGWGLRRHYPGLMLAIGIAGCLLLVILRTPVPAIAMVPLIIFDYGRWSTRYSRLAVGAGLVGAVLGPMAWMLSPEYVQGGATDWSLSIFLVLVFGCAGMVVAPYVIARFLRASDARVEERQASEAERMRHALAEREHRARTAEANARNQIARELHDIVAHSLSVIVVQAEGGRALAERKPDKAADVLNTIADTSREALDEMRRIVGVLRDGPEAANQPDYLPAPTLAEIGEMVARAGDRFRYDEQGTPPRYASRALQLTAYRVVQEAVTNVLKHGGPAARAEVIVTYHSDAVELSVIDDGHGAAAGNDLQGHGLQGMHERVHAMGGRLVARPRAGAGFAVHAVLPLAAQPPQPYRRPVAAAEAVEPGPAGLDALRATMADPRPPAYPGNSR